MIIVFSWYHFYGSVEEVFSQFKKDNLFNGAYG